MDGDKEFQGKDLDSAIHEACEFFNTDREHLEIEIVHDAKTGIFGIVGARKALIRAHRMPQEAVSSILARTTRVSPPFVSRTDRPRKGSGKNVRPPKKKGVREKASSEEEIIAAQDLEDRGCDVSREPSPGAAEAVTSQPQQRSAGSRSSGGVKKQPGDSRPGNSRSKGSQPKDSQSGDAQSRDAQPRASRGGRRKGSDERQRQAEVQPDRSGRAAGERSGGQAWETGSPDLPDPREAGSVSPGPAAQDTPVHQAPLSSSVTPDVSCDLPCDVPGEEEYPPIALETLESHQFRSLVDETVRTLIRPIVGSSVTLQMQTEHGHLCVHISSPDDLGLLIGREGQTLQSIQYIAEQILTHRAGASLHLQLDAGEYRQRQEDKLQEFIQVLVNKVRTTGRSCSTRPLSSYHRRLVHLMLQDMPDIQTRCLGDGPLRRIVVMRRRRNASQQTGEEEQQ